MNAALHVGLVSVVVNSAACGRESWTSHPSAGMGSSRTGLDLEDTSRTTFCGLGLGLGLDLGLDLDDVQPWLWLRDRAVRR